VNRFNGFLFFSRHSDDWGRRTCLAKRHGETVETVLMILAVWSPGWSPVWMRVRLSDFWGKAVCRQSEAARALWISCPLIWFW